MSYKQIGSDEYVTLEAEGNAWTIGILVTPKSEQYTIAIFRYECYLEGNHADGCEYYGDEDARYTKDSPFRGQLGDAMMGTLQESSTYSVSISYDLYRNGVRIGTNRVLGGSIRTVSYGESGGGGNLGVLTIDKANAYVHDNGKEASIFFCVNFYHYHAGEEFAIYAEVTGKNGFLNLTDDDEEMTYKPDTVTENGETYPVRWYSFIVSAAQIGYGHFAVSLKTEYHSSCYGACESCFDFHFTTLADGAPFRLLAEEWNALVGLLSNAAIDRGHSVPAVTHAKVGEKFTLAHVYDIYGLLLLLWDSVNGVDFGNDFSLPILNRMTFGARPENGISAYELLSRFERYANIALYSD